MVAVVVFRRAPGLVQAAKSVEERTGRGWRDTRRWNARPVGISESFIVQGGPSLGWAEHAQAQDGMRGVGIFVEAHGGRREAPAAARARI